MSDADLRTLALELHVLASRLLERLPGDPPPSPSPRPPEREFMDVREFADKLGVSSTTIRRQIKTGLPTKTIGRLLRIPVAEAMTWLEMHQ